jgi:elongation factor Tu
VRELLTSYGFPGNDIRWSACRRSRRCRATPKGVAGVSKLMEALDSYVPLPQRDVDKPFMMPIEDVFSISVAAPS